MSPQPLWLRDLAAYSLQAAALVAAGILMARALRLRLPRVRLAYWQGLMILCLALPLLQPWRPEMLGISSAPLSSVTFDASAAAPRGLPFAEIVLLVIAAGITIRIFWIALGLIRLWAYRRDAQRLESLPSAIEEAEQLAGASPAIFISRRLRTPATFGFFRPVVLLPERFLQMEPAMQKAIALHELLHVRRRDWLWNMLEEAVLTALWFHVPLWWVVRSARLSREQVVDAEAVRRTRQRRPYLQALLEMAGQPLLAESLPAPLFLRESDLTQRVALMMKEVHMSRTRLTVSILAATVAFLVAGASAVWTFPLHSPARPDSSTASASADSAPQPTGKTYKPGGDVQAPRAISTPQPPYTDQARKAHITGPAVFLMTIDSKGDVTGVREKSRPLGSGLDESALRTLRTWKFHPAMRKGKPVAVQVSVEVYFKLYDKKDDPAHPSPHAAADPPQSSASADANTKNPPVKINQAEIQRQVRQAVEQARKAEAQASRIDRAKIRRQVERAERQAKLAEQQAGQADAERLQLRIEALRAQDAAERQAAAKLNSAEVRRQVKQAVEDAKRAQADAAKINQADVKRQVEQAVKQARLAQRDAGAAKVDKAEIRKQFEQARRQAEAARKQSEQSRQVLEDRIRILQQQLKTLPPPAPPSPDVAPVPPAAPSAAPSPAPAAPDAAPVPPSPPSE